jgi:hypothetical protein
VSLAHAPDSIGHWVAWHVPHALLEGDAHGAAQFISAHRSSAKRSAEASAQEATTHRCQHGST